MGGSSLPFSSFPFFYHADLKQATTDLLRTIGKIESFTLAEVQGHGTQTESAPALSIRDKVVGYVPQLRVDMLLDAAQVDSVLAAFQGRDRGLSIQHGTYWVTTVERHGLFGK